jgi:hypothetical protein
MRYVCIACALVALLSFGFAREAAAPLENPPEAKSRAQLPDPPPIGPSLTKKSSPIEIRASLDKSRVCPGEKVRLTELIPRSRKTAVYGYTHYAYLVAPYSAKTNCFMSREPDAYQPRAVRDRFVDLPVNTMVLGDHTWPYSIVNPRENGYEFEFSPKCLGIYQIVAQWSIRGEGHNQIQSQPLILTVEPPVDSKGQPAIKKEWMDEG